MVALTRLGRRDFAIGTNREMLLGDSEAGLTTPEPAARGGDQQAQAATRGHGRYDQRLNPDGEQRWQVLVGGSLASASAAAMQSPSVL